MMTKPLCAPFTSPATPPPLPGWETVARRCAAMGMGSTLHRFASEAVPFAKLVPWWLLWPRDPRDNRFGESCVAMLPAAHSSLLTPEGPTPLHHDILAALLPIHWPATALADWTTLTIATAREPGRDGLAGTAPILAHLLAGSPPASQAAIWMQILGAAFAAEGEFGGGRDHHAIGLLESVGRSGLRTVAGAVLPALHNDEAEVAVAALNCLVRLGVPDASLPEEDLLSRLRPEAAEPGRLVLALLHDGDPDAASSLLHADAWGVRVQGLRALETLLERRAPGTFPAGRVDSLLELLLHQAQNEHDRDVVRCMAVTLGLCLRHAEPGHWRQVVDVAAGLRDSDRLQALLNAMLIGRPGTTLAGPIDDLRRNAAVHEERTVRALNRVQTAAGDAMSSPQDWIDGQVGIFLNMGVLTSAHLPPNVREFLESPAAQAESVLACAVKEPEHALVGTLCATALAATPSLVRVVEVLWTQHAGSEAWQLRQLLAALLAGAAWEHGASPVELRCCLGHEVGGPLEESPETIGRLLALAMANDNPLRESAVSLLQAASPPMRQLAGHCLQGLDHGRKTRSTGRRHAARLGVNVPPCPRAALPPVLAPLLPDAIPSLADPEAILAAMLLPVDQGSAWAERAIPWSDPAAVRNAFQALRPNALRDAFLRASASSQPTARRLAALLAAGTAPRLTGSRGQERVHRRLLLLAEHDSDQTVRAAATEVARALGIGAHLPAVPPPPPSDPAAAAAAAAAAEQLDEFDSDLEQTLEGFLTDMRARRRTD